LRLASEQQLPVPVVGLPLFTRYTTKTLVAATMMTATATRVMIVVLMPQCRRIIPCRVLDANVCEVRLKSHPGFSFSWPRHLIDALGEGSAIPE